jgi:hypothetical protein
MIISYLMMANRKDIMQSFTVSGTKLIVSDPCYKRGTWCQGVVDNVLPGKWNASVEYDADEGRVASLRAEHSTAKAEYNVLGNFEVGVDSGQAGIFDEAFYPQDNCGEYKDETSFYGKCCKATSGDDQAGIIDDMGAVSSSGYGDGGYECLLGFDKDNKVVSVIIGFITDDFDEEEESEDE